MFMFCILRLVMSQKIHEIKMDQIPERRGSHISNKRRKSIVKNSRFKAPSKVGLLPRERSMSSDLESLDPRSVKRVVKYENTYRTDPKEGETFSCSKMERAMKDVMEEVIGDSLYEPIKCNIFATQIANQIKERAKLFPWKRYKFIVHVIIGQNSNSSLNVGSRCLWNDTNDTFATSRYQNKTIFAVATCFAVYLE